MVAVRVVAPGGANGAAADGKGQHTVHGGIEVRAVVRGGGVGQAEEYQGGGIIQAEAADGVGGFRLALLAQGVGGHVRVRSGAVGEDDHQRRLAGAA